MAGRDPDTQRARGLFGQRHRSAREAVFESQRGRMVDAIVIAVAAKGYGAVTIADVVSRARVSRRTFYEQFESKEECFLAALDMGFDFVCTRVKAEFAALERHDWRTHIQTSVQTYVETTCAEPEFAWVVHVELAAAGGEAQKRYAGVLRRYCDFYAAQNKRARAEDSSIPTIDPNVMLAMVGGIADVARDYLLAGRLQALPEAAPALVQFAQGVVGGNWQAPAVSAGSGRRRAA